MWKGEGRERGMEGVCRERQGEWGEGGTIRANRTGSECILPSAATLCSVKQCLLSVKKENLLRSRGGQGCICVGVGEGYVKNR